MFNKTEIIKKSSIIYKSRKKLNKAYNLKKALSNLKINISNNNNSENSSHFNFKTFTDSKLYLETPKIHKSEINGETLIQKFNRDAKEMKKFSGSKFRLSAIKNHKHDKSLSEKIRDNYNNIKIIKLLNKEDKKNNNQAYYLSGEVLNQDKYISDLKNNKKDFDQFISENKNTNRTNKNKIIQCDEFNDTSTKIKNKKLNMKMKDKQIDKLAKKLALKLNFGKKDKNESKCGCGNLITLNNGYFNGTNLVMDYEQKKKNKEKEENSNNLNKTLKEKLEINKDFKETKNEMTYVNGYNFINNYLPIFLRDKFNIKGTSILSPFCIEARDEFLFKKIFYTKERKKTQRSTDIIDNKLNIFYAENQIQYNKNLIKIKEKLKKKGKIILHEIGPFQSESKMDTIKKKMNFIKKIVDYAFPNMVLAKVREKEKTYKKKNLSEINIPPFERAIKDKKEKNSFLGDFLKKSINIQNH